MSKNEEYMVYCEDHGYTAWPLCPFKCKKFPCKLVKDKNYNTPWTEETVTIDGKKRGKMIFVIFKDGSVGSEKDIQIKNLKNIQNIFEVQELKTIKTIKRREK